MIFEIPKDPAFSSYIYNNLEFSPNGSLLMIHLYRYNGSGYNGEDEETDFYDTSAWERVHTMNIPWYSPSHFTADGRMLVARGDGTIDFYGIQP